MNITEHLLTILGEEGAEIAQQVSKCNRFGLEDRNVLNPSGPTNRERLVDELNDLFAVATMLEAEGILPKGWWSLSKQQTKRAKVRKFIKYAQERGALQMADDRRQATEVQP